MTKKNFLKFNADWINELMKKKNVCFAFLKVSRRIIDGNLNIKTIMYVVYHCLQNDEKIFEKSKIEIQNNILKFYKEFRFVVIFFNWVQRKIIQFRLTFFDDDENINLFYNRKRYYWLSNMKFFGDANEVESIV